MAIKRLVDVGFWNDDKVIDMFSPEDKLFMLYILTNPHTTQLGIYKINKKIMAFELWYSIETIVILLDRFETKYNIIKYSKETNEIAIKNYLRYSIISGGKPVEDCLNKELKQVKNLELVQYVINNIKKYDDTNETIKKFINNNININDNDNDNDNDNEKSYPLSSNDTYYDSLIKEIIDYLNMRTGKNYRYNNKNTQGYIKQRIQEGYTINDFKIVIDKMCVEWMNTNMEKYLRPETLFRPSKFESYLNRTVKQTTKNINLSEKDIMEIFN